MLAFLNSIPGNGYKTYIFIFLAAVTLGLEQLGYIPTGAANQLMTWFTLGAGVGLAHKASKIQAAVDAGNSTTVPINGASN